MVYSIMIAFLTAYLLGNLNGAVCISALIADDDVRKHGSGNAGLTNFIRNYGASRALYVVIIDGGKAVLGCLSAALILEPYGYSLEGMTLGGLAVMLGHSFPALLGFKGGKGILSGLFVALVIDWRIAVLILAVFFVAYFATRYVSLASILAAAAFAAGFVVFHYDSLPVMLGGVLMGAMAIFMHRGNISRLLKGEERKTDLFKKTKQE
ncbi:MAG: glycerol-3-phosphate acyltransferase [Oscillospiraceae bacterium]|nr:glycerol-3-phosphate acyltransferase [Oscillospiraceae bacterium]